ncbi:membrane protein [Cloacibacterium rupense]|uniref:Membrane protein n=2 Tax=Cloacibacterium rupense TaxID=517423 RepID=A0ABQ2NIW1_9FLAO|nr:membrane protein [Cloacibacterium rupense]
MAVIFIATTILEKRNPAHWLGYIRAFSEAAMVGALADWFAVTALFHHPLGLKIPHTNLIEKSKEKIGDNLGSFVVSNFLSPQNIRPYIQKLKVSNFLGDWLEKEKNAEALVDNLSEIILDIVKKLENDAVVKFIGNKAKEMSNDLKINEILGNGIEYILQKNDHQKLITHLSSQIKNYVLENHKMVSDRVKKESYRLIPSFVDEKIAEKITSGLSSYFEEVENDPNHSLRKEITLKILDFSKDLKENPKYEAEFNALKDDFLQPEKVQQYAQDIWNSLKKTLIEELSLEESSLKNYVRKNLAEFSENLSTDEKLQHKIDHWIRVTAYKYILRNTNKFGELISETVGNWQGKELSQKLELEVGKDLQYIRINGTLVGGLVGLLIYILGHFFL